MAKHSTVKRPEGTSSNSSDEQHQEVYQENRCDTREEDTDCHDAHTAEQNLMKIDTFCDHPRDKYCKHCYVELRYGGRVDR